MEKLLKELNLTKEELRKYIELSDKFRTRSETAEEFGISLQEVTDIARELKVPYLNKQDIFGRYTRDEFYNYIVKSDTHRSREITAMDLNVPVQTVRLLAQNVGIKRKLRFV